MKIGHNLYEYWIHKYAWNAAHKRKQFRKLLKNGKVWLIKEPGYKLMQHFVYRTNEPIKLTRG